jgi:Ca2+-dependent lipid-binding protein
MFEFIAVGASLPPTKLNGNAWDAFGGLPDPIVSVLSSAGYGTSTYRSDTLKPVWNETLIKNQTAAALKSEMTVTVTDSDSAFDDPVGSCKLTLKDADFDGAIHTLSCPKTTESVAFTFDYKVKAK